MLNLKLSNQLVCKKLIDTYYSYIFLLITPVDLFYKKRAKLRKKIHLEHNYLNVNIYFDSLLSLSYLRM